MHITLFNNSAEMNVVDKTNSLSRIVKMDGTLRDVCNITSPAIIIELDPDILRQQILSHKFVIDDDSNDVLDDNLDNVIYSVIAQIPTANYCFIDEFNRYYYINDIETINNHLYKLYMTCDVLMSYKDKIKDLSCFVLRNEYLYNTLLKDEFEPLENITELDEHNIAGGSNRFNIIADSFPIDEMTNLYFVSFVRQDLTPRTDTFYRTSPAIHGLPAIPYGTSIYNGSIETVLMTAVDMREFIYQLNNRDKMSILINVCRIPMLTNHTISLFSNDSALAKRSRILIDSSYTFTSSKSMYTVYCNPYIEIVNDIGYSITNPTFLDYEPYSQYEMYIPFIGWINVRAEDCINKTLSLVYTFNAIDGSAYVRLLTNDKLIYTANCQLGSNFSFSSDNHYQNNILRQQTAIQMLLGVSSSITNTLKTPNTFNTGGLGVVGSIANGVLNEAKIVDKYNTTVASGNDGETTSLIAKIRRIKKHSRLSDLNSYCKLYGKPLQETKILRDLTGFTVVGSVHVENISTATKNELSQIESLLKSGVIL